MSAVVKAYNAKCSICFAYLITLVGVLIFAKGFFPMKPLPKKHENLFIPPAPANNTKLTQLLKEDFGAVSVMPKGQIPKGKLDPTVKRLVFILIDAMRFDFINSLHYRQHMPFVSKLLNKGRGILYRSRAKAPTVTLPRIKALLTGSVPGYLDVILNLDQSAELKEDSIVSSLHSANKSMVFYGCTTWIRLFPHTFLRKEGTLGLYVTDYTEVDTNVTRHLDDELSRNDWDVMILHYLGLDHVGHLVGPSSTLMPSKLSEMDAVIKQIYLILQEQPDTLILLTSDHGMTAQGSHGGTTTPEVNTPLLFLFGDPRFGKWPEPETVEQTDLAATLAILMGVPIPTTSMGRVIPSTLIVMRKEKELHALQYNCHHLLTHASHSGAYSEFDEVKHPVELYRNGLQFHGAYLFGEKQGSERMFDRARKSYIECQDAISKKLTSKLASYDYPVMAVGTCLLALGLCLSFFLWMRYVVLSRSVTVSNTDSSRRMTRALVALSLGCFLHLTTLPGSSFIEEEHQIWHFLTASVSLFVFVAFLRTIAQIKENAARERPKSSLYNAQFNESASLMRLRKGPDKSEAWTLIRGAGGDNTAQNGTSVEEVRKISNPPPHKLPVLAKDHYKYVGVAFATVISHRLLRAWNQTGIKHADEPDIEDYLNANENKTVLSIFAFVGLMFVAVMLEFICTTRDYIRTALTLVGLSGCYLFRVAICAVFLPWKTDICDKGIMESRLVYFCIGSLLAKSLFHRLVSPCSQKTRTKAYLCSSSKLCACFKNTSVSMSKSVDCFLAAIALLCALLLRPHNQCALGFNLFLYLIVFRLLWPVVVENRRHILNTNSLVLLFSRLPDDLLTSTEITARTVLAFWFGQMAYFTLGNSNSFATVDLSAAYIGLSGGQGLFNYVAAGSLGAFATYVGPILWICLLVTDIVRSGFTVADDATGRSSPVAAISIASTLANLKLLSLAVYVAVATGHRFHLFVWSVFSPKLMYELVSTAVHFGLLLVVMFFC